MELIYIYIYIPNTKVDLTKYANIPTKHIIQYNRASLVVAKIPKERKGEKQWNRH